MPVFIVTGKTGQGKGLCSVGLAMEYLSSGRPVATNMDLFPERFRDKYNRNIHIIRIPDYPTAQDLHNLGFGNDHPENEDDNGLLLLDEGATWLNSRNWNQPGRKELNDWLVQRRKWGWDVAIQIQSIDSMDGQARQAVADYEVRAFKVDTIRIPIITGLIKKVTGVRRVRFPSWARWHTAKMRNLETGMCDDVHRYTGRDIYPLYDTTQKMRPDYPHGMHCLLTPWHLVGRYMGPRRGFSWWLRFVVRMPVLLLLWVLFRFHPGTRDFLRRELRYASR